MIRELKERVGQLFGKKKPDTVLLERTEPVPLPAPQSASFTARAIWKEWRKEHGDWCSAFDSLLELVPEEDGGLKKDGKPGADPKLIREAVLLGFGLPDIEMTVNDERFCAHACEEVAYLESVRKCPPIAIEIFAAALFECLWHYHRLIAGKVNVNKISEQFAYQKKIPIILEVFNMLERGSPTGDNLYGILPFERESLATISISTFFKSRAKLCWKQDLERTAFQRVVSTMTHLSLLTFPEGEKEVPDEPLIGGYIKALFADSEEMFNPVKYPPVFFTQFGEAFWRDRVTYLFTNGKEILRHYAFGHYVVPTKFTVERFIYNEKSLPIIRDYATAVMEYKKKNKEVGEFYLSVWGNDGKYVEEALQLISENKKKEEEQATEAEKQQKEKESKHQSRREELRQMLLNWK